MHTEHMHIFELFFRKCKAEIDMILMVKNYLLWGVLNVCIPHPPSKIYVT